MDLQAMRELDIAMSTIYYAPQGIQVQEDINYFSTLNQTLGNAFFPVTTLQPPSISGKKLEQLDKFLNTSNPDFFNPYNKRAILYIKKPLTEIQRAEILNTIPNNVSLANSLDQLKLLLK